MKKNLLTILVLHCTATPAGRVVTPDEIKQWHMGPLHREENGDYVYKGQVYKSLKDLPKEKIGGQSIYLLSGRGWSQLGYSDMFMLDGSIVNLVKYNDDEFVDSWELTNGILKTDKEYFISRHAVYVGGTDKKGKPLDTRTAEQLKAMKDYVFDTIKKHPSIKIAGHNQFAQKACPSFSVPSWLRSIGVNDKNIF